ncbi:uncharacterized protein LOC111706854 [Eurytemora carolleeae]|uniref:uncharacterized protein LOC111706854 n=1 Tax=Eurytemora carolleeae TaxID=1294199 RepID=UPI000C7944D7|nr:uncharacterized protein LOC111706854 [Eurytemora carolleeae]|eukprot:XP_023335551.1 uncharacterized protein LOC111706854 [Eurytemora affinis]
MYNIYDISDRRGHQQSQLQQQHPLEEQLHPEEQLEAADSTAVKALRLLTPATACSAAISLILAISTPCWLYTEERFKNQNRTVMFGKNSSPEYLSKKTISGMWTLCQTKLSGSNYSCGSINYFPVEEYRADDADSTNAIPHAMLNSSGYILVSCIMLLVAEYFCFAGLFIRKNIILIKKKNSRKEKSIYLHIWDNIHTWR